MLIELGITGILEKIVIPGVQRVFSPETLRYFRDCWQQGQVPDSGLPDSRINSTASTLLSVEHKEVHDDWLGSLPPVVGYRDPAFIFVQIDTQHNFIERWTVFGGLWFEEIEPLIH